MLEAGTAPSTSYSEDHTCNQLPFTLPTLLFKLFSAGVCPAFTRCESSAINYPIMSAMFVYQLGGKYVAVGMTETTILLALHPFS